MEVEDLKTVFNDFWSWMLSEKPEFCTYVGLDCHTDRLDCFREDTFCGRKEFLENLLIRLGNLDPSNLSEQDEDNYELLINQAKQYLDGIQYKNYLLTINNFQGVQADFPRIIKKMKYRSAIDYNNYLARLQAFQQQVNEVILLLERGVTEGIVNHKISLKGVEAQLNSLIKSEITELSLYNPLLFMPDCISKEQKEDFQRKGKQLLNDIVIPSYQKIRDFILVNYFPCTRTTLSVTSLPGGMERYIAHIKFHTETDLSPLEIHRLGLQLLEDVHSKTKLLMEKVGFKGTIREFENHLKQDSFIFTSEDEMIKAFEQKLQRILPKLPMFFKSLPDIPLNVEKVLDKNYPTLAYYQAPSGLTGEPGHVFLKCYKPHTVLPFTFMTLALHEGLPGHHFQACHRLHNENLPMFLRYKDDRRTYDVPGRLPLYTAYTEGWGLYSEELGIEMGLLQDPHDLFGYYTSEMQRICRLVVDTGIHAFGWSQEMAETFLYENTSLSLNSIETEVTRYITWPAQTLSYKLGHLKIRNFREHAEKILGTKFNICAFHEICLNCGQVPLKMLEKQIQRWIAKTLTQTGGIREN